ncbi:hypothetical protein T440DRAFT_464093 [Plenodomus tracheiphilus IPT5]|uniref:Uncharacterized protein n=1 Tax=Plenodomus tracheiphilus IPT5 TaxID=1408161 RepID=A0A6A7BK02_9PLEO|nr:hypothetical protein T440DRAFT_464093 [Plenodomus tracheiphilus IPT5]
MHLIHTLVEILVSHSPPPSLRIEPPPSPSSLITKGYIYLVLPYTSYIPPHAPIYTYIPELL